MVPLSMTLSNLIRISRSRHFWVNSNHYLLTLLSVK